MMSAVQLCWARDECTRIAWFAEGQGFVSKLKAADELERLACAKEELLDEINQEAESMKWQYLLCRFR